MNVNLHMNAVTSVIIYLERFRVAVQLDTAWHQITCIAKLMVLHILHKLHLHQTSKISSMFRTFTTCIRLFSFQLHLPGY